MQVGEVFECCVQLFLILVVVVEIDCNGFGIGGKGLVFGFIGQGLEVSFGYDYGQIVIFQYQCYCRQVINLVVDYCWLVSQ